MTSRIVPVILCGGSGTRLWPLSRAGFPKQFLSLTGDETLFQQAVLRIAGLESADVEVSAPLIVTNEEHRFIAAEQLRESGIEPGAFLLEPVGRNTAPALSFATLAALEQGGDPILVVTPSDQMVVNQPAFIVAMQTAIRAAETGAIVVLGISPDRPEIGYGYIKAATEGTALLPEQIFPVERFVEKPDTDTAQSYLDEGGYYWNAGIFVLKASVWMASLERFRPDIGVAVHVAWARRSMDKMFIRPGKAEFAAIPAESIDFAVMEQCPASEFSVKMVPLAAGWSDLGAWDAVWKVLTKDASGNVYFGDVLTTDSLNTLVYATSRLVSLVGVEDLIVIETADAVLVADRSSSQNVKAIVNQLNSTGREEHTLHRKVHRPWGWYDGIDEGERFKVKRIQVNPKASLSLQKHHHRAEHWVVVKGTAEIVCGDKTIFLTENQSTYIPLGETHRLTNPGAIPLEIIEVQSGSYLGEDDIVRFEDSYGR
jgi:mannose-1-phosphate guanylyltransferase/mannose-6-phosphate isomerase